MEGVENDYAKQSKIVWTNLVEILKELGVGMKEIIQVTVNFKLVILNSRSLLSIK